MLNLNYKHLYYFYVVAKEGSVKLAAEKLFVSQPTISDQIKLLEDYFGTKLFERRNRGVYLTGDGQVALDYAQKIFDLGSEVTSRLRNQLLLPKKTVDIGISPHMSQYFLFGKLSPIFSQKGVSVVISEKPRTHLLAELEEEKIDIVFTDSREHLTPNMSSFRVGLNRTFVVAHKKYEKLKNQFPNSLQKIPYFGYSEGSSLRYEIELFFAQNDIAPKTIGEGGHIEMFQMVTEQGLAFTIVPEIAKKRLCLSPNIITLGEIEDFQTTVWGVIKKGKKGPALKLLKELRDEKNN